MTKFRYDRIGEEIKREISEIIRDEIKDPGMGFISITKVMVTSDLHNAKVYYSVLGDDEARKATALSLKRSAGFIRREVANRLSLRHTPELTFIFDDSIEHGIKISKIIHDQIEREENANDGKHAGGEEEK